VLTYCTNIHPGEDWSDVVRNLEAHTLEVKAAVSPQQVFPLGLRISARAASQIDAAESRRFRHWCEAHGFAVATLNGFPHGQFHGARVKERVYLPDWRDAERSRYTIALADLLSEWLPAGQPGSISTVPVAFARGFDSRPHSEDWRLVRARILDTLEHLLRLRERSGAEIVLAFEPEPGCVLQTSADVVAFFEALRLPARLQGLAGICLDCCHHAVVYEDLSEALRRLEGAAIRIAKVQASSAILARGEEILRLAQLDEPTYLHQLVARDARGALHAFDDLPDFFASGLRAVECRVHFHVPIFAAHLGLFGTTQDSLRQLLSRLGRDVLVEVETYTFDVLPAALRPPSVAESLALELRFARAILQRPDADAHPLRAASGAR
jgi:sugar phosphate isomerase/epimerase